MCVWVHVCVHIHTAEAAHSWCPPQSLSTLYTEESVSQLNSQVTDGLAEQVLLGNCRLHYNAEIKGGSRTCLAFFTWCLLQIWAASALPPEPFPQHSVFLITRKSTCMVIEGKKTPPLHVSLCVPCSCVRACGFHFETDSLDVHGIPGWSVHDLLESPPFPPPRCM